jgi:hypothetical protein
MSDHKSFEINETKLNSKKKEFWQSWWFWLIVVFIIYKLTNSPTTEAIKPAIAQPVSQIKTQQSTLPTESLNSAQLSVESQFINIVSAAQKEGADANDMKVALIKSKRDKKLCQLLANLNIKDWIGNVKSIYTSNIGEGVLAVTIAEDITLTNENFSGQGTYTMLKPNSALFKTASNLNGGQRIKFSGKLISDKESCVSEAANSMAGQLSDPEFILKFNSISPQ